jgi:preprotein translocase subunit SecY
MIVNLAIYMPVHLLKLLMIRTTCFIKRNVVVLARITALTFIVGVSGVAIVSIQDSRAAGGITGGSSQSISNVTIGVGPNITGSISLRNMIAKQIGPKIHVSLANASTIAEKTVGPNAHAVSVRLGVVRGFIVYIALVSDINHGVHTVLVDPGNGKVLQHYGFW